MIANINALKVRAVPQSVFSVDKLHSPSRYQHFKAMRSENICPRFAIKKSIEVDKQSKRQIPFVYLLEDSVSFAKWRVRYNNVTLWLIVPKKVLPCFNVSVSNIESVSLKNLDIVAIFFVKRTPYYRFFIPPL